ncbi:hypothetical protein M9H77_31042 [Catharanthus roseus]|uniref:Uncharacterized protein n=1 Tax=Catharanthus roseus TaxID=4058 RepID=A0ACC0A0T5_CATRO|nr:hypothetical protein M9H77_31042 [Catharanthus roseus]
MKNKNNNLSAPKEVIKDDESRALMNEDIVHGSMERDNVGKQSVEAIKSLRTTEKKLVEREKRKPGKRLDLVGSESNGLKQDKKEGRRAIGGNGQVFGETAAAAQAGARERYKCLFYRVIRQHIIIMEAKEMVYYSSEHALILAFLPGCVVLFFVSSPLLALWTM